MKDRRVILRITRGALILVCLSPIALIAQDRPSNAAPTQSRAAKPLSELTTPVSPQKNAETISSGKDDAKPATEKDAAQPPVIVVGFLGGFVGHDNMVHSPVQIAAHLRGEHPSGVYVKVFENHRREDAHREILSLLDVNHHRKIPAEEKQKARIIIYGISWGGSETVALARELDGEHIPVLLTVQVDSVAKVRQNDDVIPPNVSEAANFFQTDGLLHGQTKIRAADEKRTRILGNFQMNYKSKEVACTKYPWWDKIFVKYHTEIECDPALWNQVESLIQSKLPR